MIWCGILGCEVFVLLIFGVLKFIRLINVILILFGWCDWFRLVMVCINLELIEFFWLFFEKVSNFIILYF